MAFFEKYLAVRKSRIPKAGLGLFTKTQISKGQTIVEYKGRLSLWRTVRHLDSVNPYLMRVTRTHAIDAAKTLKTLGRYANDAKGKSKQAGLVNNAEYVSVGKRCFIEATRNIPAGSEILVSYGKDYWKVFS